VIRDWRPSVMQTTVSIHAWQHVRNTLTCTRIDFARGSSVVMRRDLSLTHIVLPSCDQSTLCIRSSSVSDSVSACGLPGFCGCTHRAPGPPCPRRARLRVRPHRLPNNVRRADVPPMFRRRCRRTTSRSYTAPLSPVRRPRIARLSPERVHCVAIHEKSTHRVIFGSGD
jgi:hypothetical protein